MCQVSNKLKLCTCSATSPDKLKNYWVFHRFIKEKDYQVMGSMVGPYTVDAVTEKHNKETLLKRVNEADAFDINLNPQPKDRLQLNFITSPDRWDCLTYGFEFIEGKWIEYDYHPFEWEEHHTDESFGKIKDAVVKK